jgi:Flp pilus assembly protein TadG|tara:strand:+ start:548 stop:889 length:342 start_codon:yes stop_codon:yes gene_type:complete
MAVNQYKFLGTNIATSVEQTVLTPSQAGAGSVETVIIKSFRVTNTTGNTPTITITNGTTKIVNLQALVANSSIEILTLPLIVESGVALKVKMSSADSIDIGISYLNITQEVTI